MNDRSITLWQGMSGRDRDLLMAKPTVPAVIALGYGVYKFVDLGTSIQFALYTYAVTAGAVASIIFIFLYSLGASRPATKGLVAWLVGSSGFVPYLYSIYLMGVLGCYGIWLSIRPLSILGIAIGLVWIVLGYRMLWTFWVITELTVRR